MGPLSRYIPDEQKRCGMRLIYSLCAAVFATSANAQVADTKSAGSMLFPTKGHAIQVSSKLSDQDRTTIVGVIPLMAKQLNQPVRYYASIAYSPDDGLVHEALQAAMNYHTVAAADAAAVAACNKLRSRGAQSCRVAARIVPKGYKARPLTLSVEATEGFNRTYKKTKGDKALAISEATGAWGMGKSDAAALSQCRAKDCKIVIRK